MAEPKSKFRSSVEGIGALLGVIVAVITIVGAFANVLAYLAAENATTLVRLDKSAMDLHPVLANWPLRAASFLAGGDDVDSKFPESKQVPPAMKPAVDKLRAKEDKVEQNLEQSWATDKFGCLTIDIENRTANSFDNASLVITGLTQGPEGGLWWKENNTFLSQPEEDAFTGQEFIRDNNGERLKLPKFASHGKLTLRAWGLNFTAADVELAGMGTVTKEYIVHERDTPLLSLLHHPYLFAFFEFLVVLVAGTLAVILASELRKKPRVIVSAAAPTTVSVQSPSGQGAGKV